MCAYHRINLIRRMNHVIGSRTRLLHHPLRANLARRTRSWLESAGKKWRKGKIGHTSWSICLLRTMGAGTRSVEKSRGATTRRPMSVRATCFCAAVRLRKHCSRCGGMIDRFGVDSLLSTAANHRRTHMASLGYHCCGVMRCALCGRSEHARWLPAGGTGCAFGGRWSGMGSQAVPHYADRSITTPGASHIRLSGFAELPFLFGGVIVSTTGTWIQPIAVWVGALLMATVDAFPSSARQPFQPVPDSRTALD